MLLAYIFLYVGTTNPNQEVATMKKIFRNSLGQRLIFNDEGIIFEARAMFYPYGSIDKVKLGLMNVFSVTHNGFPVTYSADSADKQALKEMVDYVLNAKKTAPVAKPSPYKQPDEYVVLPKDAAAIIEYFGGMTSKMDQAIAAGIPSLIDSMGADEEILHVFDGSVIYANKGANKIDYYIAWISNKRFYYTGTDAASLLRPNRSGYVELKDVHAISSGTETVLTNPYIQFEVKNEEYKICGYYDISKVKTKLEEAVSMAQNADNVPAPAAASPIDELKKYKELLDMGILTQEEFDAKKKQLLGL